MGDRRSRFIIEALPTRVRAPEPRDGRSFPVAALAVALGLALRASVIALPTEHLSARYLADDYFYYLGVAAKTGALVRYFYPVWAILAMLLARSFRREVVALVLLVHALDAAVYVRWDRTTPPAASFVGSAHVLAPAVIERLVPAGQFIGSFDAGALGYFSPRPVINLDGLANHEIVELRRTCRLPYATCLRDYLRAKGIGVLAGGTGFGWTGHFHDWTAWERLYESPPLVDGSHLVILRIPPTAK